MSKITQSTWKYHTYLEITLPTLVYSIVEQLFATESNDWDICDKDAKLCIWRKFGEKIFKNDDVSLGQRLCPSN